MAVQLLSFGEEFLRASLDFFEPNLVYEHQNVDQGTNSYPEGVLSIQFQFLRASLDFFEPNLVYEHQNVDQGTNSYPEGVLSILGCRF